MESANRQLEANNLVDQLVQHLGRYPHDLRHVRKLMLHFQASADDVAQAIEQIAAPVILSVDPEKTADKVLLYFLQNPDDVIDMRWVMRHMHASSGDIQHALAKLEAYIVESGEGDIRVSIDKK